MPDFQSDLRPQGISFCPRRKETAWFFNTLSNSSGATAITAGWMQRDSVAGPCWSCPHSGQLMKISSPAATTRPPPRSEGTISEQSQECLSKRNCECSGQDEFLMTSDGIFSWLDHFLPNCVCIYTLCVLLVHCFAVFSACLAFRMVTEAGSSPFQNQPKQPTIPQPKGGWTFMQSGTPQRDFRWDFRSHFFPSFCWSTIECFQTMCAVSWSCIHNYCINFRILYTSMTSIIWEMCLCWWCIYLTGFSPYKRMFGQGLHDSGHACVGNVGPCIMLFPTLFIGRSFRRQACNLKLLTCCQRN